MIDIQVPMMRWTRSRGLVALLEEIRAPKKLITPLTVKNGEKATCREDAFLID